MRISVWLFIVLLAGPATAQQNPSPMAETTRAHERVEAVERDGIRRSIDAGFPASLFIPEDAAPGALDLLIHFMGADYIAEDAVARGDFHEILAVVNLGSGSSVFERPLDKPHAFDTLLDSIRMAVSRAREDDVRLDHIDLSAFSAGYGAVRAILRHHPDRVHGVLLLDALHTGYVPDHTPLAQGGRLDTTLLEPFLRFARKAIDGEKSFVLTHSEVFPGAFASTTEAADYLLDALALSREAVLRWGPVGMQQLSTAGTGKFRVLGFAGNSAPDHVDHLHGLAEFLPLLHSR